MRGIYVESRPSGPAFYVWSMCVPSASRAGFSRCALVRASGYPCGS
ncbi:hypothetical protein HMPREF0762_01031 [Slackia exigua ATCC 700122]|uniref:Uncharacterized protein n=1 Tax=Slackia exigua (strain ATCC 700122 / DSM 15923 / CIP 105133 / JCM 11022 / KCTC 5966 / S-7) TaxID=649764 RepID=D0WGS7_SLAES|nr:hypothetical protein HMPREF0762_01031 [Slackia exigua ATCC 700122]